MCVAWDFRGGDGTKFQRHQESAGHLEKMDPLTSEIAIQHSKSPKFIPYGEDVIRLSKEESAKHWLSVAGDGANEETSSDVEDIREQILPDEPMNIPSPAGDNEQIKRIQDTTVKIDAGTNTECTQLDDIAKTIHDSMTIPCPAGDNGQESMRIQDPTEQIDAGTNTECSQLDNIAATIIKTHEELRSMNAQMVETLSKVYQFAEKLVQVNIKQEGVIKWLEEKLESMERRERRVKEAERDRRVRAEHRDNHHHGRDRRVFFKIKYQ